VVDQVEVRAIGLRHASDGALEDPRVGYVHRHEGLRPRDAARDERIALRLVDADDAVRDERAQSLLDAEQPADERPPGELRGVGLRQRIVDVEHDLGAAEARQQAGEDEEVRQVVHVHDVDAS
jgi:hypothetical protein